MGNFYTDVIRASPHFRSPYRISDPALLEPATRRKVEAILRDADAHGATLGIYETYRSEERQERLFSQGAARYRNVGVHHFGLAADIVFLVDGEPSWKGDFGLVGHLARAHGLVWGGEWDSRGGRIGEEDHVQRCALWQQADLFRGDWYPA